MISVTYLEHRCLAELGWEQVGEESVEVGVAAMGKMGVEVVEELDMGLESSGRQRSWAEDCIVECIEVVAMRVEQMDKRWAPS